MLQIEYPNDIGIVRTHAKHAFVNAFAQAHFTGKAYGDRKEQEFGICRNCRAGATTPVISRSLWQTGTMYHYRTPKSRSPREY